MYFRHLVANSFSDCVKVVKQVVLFKSRQNVLSGTVVGKLVFCFHLG